MSVSIIIPFYKGEKYFTDLKKNLEKVCLKSPEDVEVILVNDSPEEKKDDSTGPDWDVMKSETYRLEVIQHEKNSGIHQARVTGLKAAKGDYILFLDQDDYIEPDFLSVMCKALQEKKDAAYCFANGTFDEGDRKKIILNSYGKVEAAQKYESYVYVGNLLSSPGQCLIRKDAIPQVWKTDIMMSNCSDDLLLWILLLRSGRAEFVNRMLYRHRDSGSNLSADEKAGFVSDMEVCEILKRNKALPAKLQKFMEKRCRMHLYPEKYGIVAKKSMRFQESARRGMMRIKGIAYALAGRRINKT